MSVRNLVVKFGALLIFGGALFIVFQTQGVLGSWVPLGTTIALLVSLTISIWIIVRSFTRKATGFHQLTVAGVLMLGGSLFALSKDWSWYWGLPLGIVSWLPILLLDVSVIRPRRAGQNKSAVAPQNGTSHKDEFSLDVKVDNPGGGGGFINLAQLFSRGEQSLDLEHMVAQAKALESVTGALNLFKGLRESKAITDEQFWAGLKRLGLDKLFQVESAEKPGPSTPKSHPLENLMDFLDGPL
jgi:hypothetical protein